MAAHAAATRGRVHAWHLFSIWLVGDQAGDRRRAAFDALREHGIGVNVHYLLSARVPAELLPRLV